MSCVWIRLPGRMGHWPIGQLPCPAARQIHKARQPLCNVAPGPLRSAAIDQQVGWAWPNLPCNHTVTACGWLLAIHAGHGSLRFEDLTIPPYGACRLLSRIPIQSFAPYGDMAVHRAVPCAGRPLAGCKKTEEGA